MQKRRSVQALLALLLLLLVTVSTTAQDSTLQEVADAAADAVLPDPAEVAKEMGVPEELVDQLEELDDIIEKYRNAEVDFVKWEDVTIKDTEGNPVACPIKVYYDNFEGADFSTGSDGRFSGGISFGNTPLTKPICIKVDCDCKTISLQHKRDFGQVNEVLEKIKKTIQQKIEEDVGEALDEMSEPYKEELKEQLIKQALANTGAEGFTYATPVLMAFYVAGKTIGETIAWELENFFSMWFDYIKKFNQGTYNPQLFQLTGYDCSPGSDRYKKHTQPWLWGRWWQEAPYLTDTWNIVVDCKEKDTGPRWINPDDPDYNPTPPPDPVKEKDDDYIPLPEKVKDAIGQQQQEWITLVEREWEESREREEEEYQQYLIGVKQRAEQFRKECPICDPIREQIKTLMDEISKLQEELKAALEKLRQAEITLKQRTLEREAYERDLAQYNDPQSFIASNGRVVTDSDLRVKRWAYGRAEEEWRNGGMTSQELHNFWQNYDHAAAVGEFIAALTENVKRAQQAEKGSQEAVQQLQNLVQTIRGEISEYEAAIERLKKDLDECIKRCQERAEEYVRLPPTPPSLPTSTCKDTPPCCDFLKLLNRYGGRSLSDWHDIAGSKGYRENLGITDQQLSLMYDLYEKCEETISESPPAPPPSLPSTSEPPPLPPPIPPTPPKSCSEVCSSLGMYYPQPDYTSTIQNQLSGVVCVSGIRITIRTTSKDGCTCYPSAPEVTVTDGTKPVCKDTFCGDVPCGETRTCQESDGVIAAYSASCTWQGWRVSGTSATPVLDVQ